MISTLKFFTLLFGKSEQGRRYGGDWGRNSPPTPQKGRVCKSSKTDEKILGVERVTSPTIPEFQPVFVTSGFQRSDLTSILSNKLLTNFILLKLFSVI